MILARGNIRYLEKGMNEDSILLSVKKLLGPTAGDTAFDTDIIIHINAALATLHQLGVGPKKGFAITDNSATWKDYVGNDLPLIGLLRSYVYLKVKIVFDPPTSSFVLEAYKQNISEYEWRIQSAVNY